MPHSNLPALQKQPNHLIAAHHRWYKATGQSPFQSVDIHVFSPAGYVGMQLVPKTTRNPHQIWSVVLRLGAWSGAKCFWGWAEGEEGQTAGPVPVPLPGNLRGLDTSVRQKQTSRWPPAQTGVPRQRFWAEVPGARWRTHRQVSSTAVSFHKVVFVIVLNEVDCLIELAYVVTDKLPKRIRALCGIAHRRMI